MCKSTCTLYIVLKWSLTNKLISTCSKQSLILWLKSEIWHGTIYRVNQQVESVEALELHKMSESHIIMAGRKFWNCLCKCEVLSKSTE
jgi:hypothetical protein